jgi:hypothetical protein
MKPPSLALACYAPGSDNRIEKKSARRD